LSNGITTAEVEQEIDSKEIGTAPSENEGQPHNIKDTFFIGGMGKKMQSL